MGKRGGLVLWRGRRWKEEVAALAGERRDVRREETEIGGKGMSWRHLW